MSRLEGAIAAVRFGLGARPSEIEAASADPQAWLLKQIGGGASPPRGDLPASGDVVRKLMVIHKPGEREPDSGKALALLDEFKKIYAREILARVNHALTADAPFTERWLRFWSNHLAVGAEKLVTLGIAGAYEREAIRPHLFGPFAELLLAAYRHPAMLLYLDQAQSMGPSARFAQYASGRGLNENLAREAMELHTVGVEGGYRQKDVEELARALTGWTVGWRFHPEPVKGKFLFEPRMHEPGPRTVMGRRYAQEGEKQAEAVLRDLARHPKTARRLAGKLARHFIADDPPASAVSKLERVYLDTDGNLGALARALAGLDAAWDPALRKFKTPEDFLLSALRGAGVRRLQQRGALGSYAALGQRPWANPSPEGWPDGARDWAGPDAIVKRLEWSQALARRLARADPAAFLETALGPLAGERLREHTARAAGRAQALTLALMSPEFQRR